MSIRKEIEQALKEGHGVIRINDICNLAYSTYMYDGKQRTLLMCLFDFVTSVKGGKAYEIESRDYDGIIAEVGARTQEYLAQCAEAAIKNMNNGYRE